jgi:hypothetical protein
MTSDDTPLWLFADQLGPAVYGGEHVHREVLGHRHISRTTAVAGNHEPTQSIPTSTLSTPGRPASSSASTP